MLVDSGSTVGSVGCGVGAGWPARAGARAGDGRLHRSRSSWWADVSLGTRLRIAESQPILLIGEADRHQQSSEAEKADDAIALAEVAHVIEEGLGDGEDQQEQRLPADEGRALPETDREQAGTVHHEEGRDRESLLELSFGVARRDGAMRSSSRTQERMAMRLIAMMEPRRCVTSSANAASSGRR